MPCARACKVATLSPKNLPTIITILQDLRLSQLGLSAEQAERALNIPGYTRCLGYHDAKGGYTDVDALRDFFSMKLLTLTVIIQHFEV